MNVWQCDDSRPVPGLVPAKVEALQKLFRLQE